MRPTWYRDCFRQVHMDFHMPEFPREAIRNFNAARFVDHLERGKVSLVALFAKCHFGNSFYNTAVGHKHSGLAEDFLMEAAGECRKRGIRTLAYYSLCVDKHAHDANPDWRYVDEDGRTYAGRFGSVCMNTPYKDELVVPQLAELARNYPIDGFFLDIPFPWGPPVAFCCCRYCRQKWQAELDIADPPALPVETKLRLMMLTAERYLREVRDVIERHNPDLALCVNAHGAPYVSRRLKELVDIGVWESQPHPGDYLGHSFACRTGRNDVVNLQVMTVRFYQGWGDLSLKPTPQLTTELAAMIGNGQCCNVGDQVNIDGSLQPAVYETLGESFGFVARREGVLRQAESVRHAVVLLPVPDAELPMTACEALRRPDAGFRQFPPAWRGAHKMLVESHVQVDLAYSILAGDLGAYPVLILPGGGWYDDGMDDRLRAYVDGGGILVAAGEAILRGGRCGLADLFGIEYVEPLAFTACHFRPAEALKHATADVPLQLRGQGYKIRLAGAEELAALYYPAAACEPPGKGFRHEYPPAAFTRSPWPFATVRRCGRGQAVYVAANIFEVYWRTNHHWLRQFTEALLRHVDEAMPYEVDAAGTIEANLMRVGGDLLLNLIHYSLGHQGGPSAIAAIERVHPVHDVACRVRCGRVEEVVLAPEEQPIDFEHADGICRFTVPAIEYLAMVRLVAAAPTP